MIDKRPNGHMDIELEAAWKKLLGIFMREDSTVAEEYLYDSHSTLSFNNNKLIQILEWARRAHLIEPAEEVGRIRLTPQGKDGWRNTRDTA